MINIEFFKGDKEIIIYICDSKLIQFEIKERLAELLNDA
jgi:hypothetical protein